MVEYHELEEPAAEPRWPRRYSVLGVQVSATSYDELVPCIVRVAERREPAIVSCHAVHAIVTASRAPDLREAVNSFDAITPDGQPVRWALNGLHGTRLADRVYGPELMLRVCRAAAAKGIGIYLYGGTPAVLERLVERLQARDRELRIVGAEAPPFRELTADEDRAMVERVRQSSAGIVFIGLGCPKQDFFAARHRGQFAAVQICVGAAFDFHAGVKAMAPGWMQRSGLEWLFRLASEPRRLWRRYLVTNSQFVLGVARQAWRTGRTGSAPDVSRPSAAPGAPNTSPLKSAREVETVSSRKE